ncbi:hypothetical protein DOTSEDRAFT_67625 [Dothistroma septosporum NZE10]|uniref:protein-tyrosine-phosphatase n=1 Tax=Dothistroma septosporum (strain NZE10 / CBS 128990) TaxID=675120 RepID=N1PYZ8_DOTSN|nr:hypothetical protein DOTSEDRAFT_67625 [Dothistroma septosporum NZE10]
MNGHSPEASLFAPRSVFSHQHASINMSQAEELTKLPPQLATSTSTRALFPGPGYDGVLRKFHHHNLSDSTNTTGSNESSPTTTISTVDDSSATEPSPGSSPESPPPSTFSVGSVGMLRPRTADDQRGAFFELQKSPPPRKGRNLKNLAVNTTRQPGRASSTTSLPLNVPSDSNATTLSPSFVKPLTPPRRKPSNLGLTILTPAPAKQTPQEVRLIIPPTPGFGRPNTLRQYQSSPSLPLIPGLGLPHNSHILQQRTLDTIFSPLEQKEAIPADDDEEQNFDVPLSREEKPEAYPDGPICVYEPGIDLYLEPNAEQCRQYDVVMNVASEVLNPMIERGDSVPAQPDLRLDGGGGIQFAPKRSNLIVTSQVPAPVTDDASPSTPKATPLEEHFLKQGLPSIAEKEPDYIHIKWEHNSDIVPDLLGLVRLIDAKVMDGKRILIHCQCGVSRSASLVVAYGLYKDPSLSVQEAYDAVKKRSKWIGPNMNLIMQLQEFRSSLARGGLLSGNRGLSPIEPSSALSEWTGPFSSMTSPASTREIPLTAAMASNARDQTTDDLTALSPGPSSAPSGVLWPSIDKRADRPALALKPATAYVDPSGHVVPVLNVVDTDTKSAEPLSLPEALPLRSQLTSSKPALSSPRSAEFAMIPVKPAEDADPADSFGILSPTSTEFATNPFDRPALLASLGMGSMRPEEEAPRRSLSLRKQQQQLSKPDAHLGASAGRPLRGRVSSPSLREQQQLRSLQAKIEASLATRTSPATQLSAGDEPLISPRATGFTRNPFSLALNIPSVTTASPKDQAASKHIDEDPRSPVAREGASSITRNIYTFL